MTFDWTDIFVALIGLVAVALGCGLRYVWKNTIQPWLEERGLEDAAWTVVCAAEAILGRYCGPDKWQLALSMMEERGWNINEAAVFDALQAAWKQLDLSQIAAGEKPPALVEPETEEENTEE